MSNLIIILVSRLCKHWKIQDQRTLLTFSKTQTSTLTWMNTYKTCVIMTRSKYKFGKLFIDYVIISSKYHVTNDYLKCMLIPILCIFGFYGVFKFEYWFSSTFQCHFGLNVVNDFYITPLNASKHKILRYNEISSYGTLHQSDFADHLIDLEMIS